MKCFSLFLFFFLAGCGLEDTTKATLSAVDKTNETSTNIYEQVKRTADLTGDLKEILGSTEDRLHAQTLMFAYQGLRAPENTKFLNPPLLLMPYAETFSKEATQLELSRFMHLLAMDVKFSPVEAKESRLVSLVILSALAAFTPAEKFQNILRTEIDHHGVYEESAILFALGRYIFIRDYFVQLPLERAAILYKSQLKETISHFTQLSVISHLPYVSSLQIEIPDLELTLKVDPSQWAKFAKDTKDLFLAKMPKEELSNEEVQAHLNLFQ